MAKKALSLLTLILTLLVASAAAAQTWYVKTGDGKPLNVRSGPSKTSGIIGTVKNGNALEVVELVEDGVWAKVVYGNRTGYCMAAYLDKAEDDLSGDLGYTLVYDESLFSFEQAGGVDAYWWKAQETGMPNCYLSVSRLTGYTLDEAMEGLILQADFEGTRSTITLDGQEASTFTFAQGTDADDAVTQYVCVPRSDGSILLIELSYYTGAKDTIGQYLQEMLLSITFSTPETASGPDASVGYVQCPDCGQWFEAGNVFRNHICPAKNETEYVQCPDCGQWFEAGNVFRNHICPAKNETEYVQCPDCGQWFEAGNVFRNHICPAREEAAAGAADDAEYVQCDICGQWFRAGNEFRNHLCVSYPDNLDDEISIVEDYPEA